MPDNDPPHEIHNREAPSDGNVYAPNPHTNCEKDCDCVEKHQQEQKRDSKAQKPSGPLSLTQNNRADLVGYGGDRVARLDHRWLTDFGRSFERISVHVDCPRGEMISIAVWVQGSFATSSSSAPAGDVLTSAGFATLRATTALWANSVRERLYFPRYPAPFSAA